MRKNKVPKMGRLWGVNLFTNKGKEFHRRRTFRSAQPNINGILIGNYKIWALGEGESASEERKDQKESQWKKGQRPERVILR